jgi:ATP synthase I chain
VFAHFSLPSVPDVARRTVSTALIVGVAALVGCVAFGHLLLGVGACVGLALGTFNFRMIGNSVARVSARQEENKRRPLALNTLGRMGIITVVTIGLLFVSPSLGFGVLGGLAVFQLVLLVNVARSMAKAGPMTSVDDVINANVVEDNVTRTDPHPAVGSPDEPRGGE